MAPSRSGLLAVRTDDVEDGPRSHFRHGLLGLHLRSSLKAWSRTLLRKKWTIQTMAKGSR